MRACACGFAPSLIPMWTVDVPFVFKFSTLSVLKCTRNVQWPATRWPSVQYEAGTQRRGGMQDVDCSSQMSCCQSVTFNATRAQVSGEMKSVP